MTGQAIVTIDNKIWTCEYASTSAELIAGLSNVASIAPMTGILFDMDSDQSSIPINTSKMLFNIDIAFINSLGVVVAGLLDVSSSDVAGYSGSGARYFMEVNAGELDNVVGEQVSIQLSGTDTDTDTGNTVLSQAIVGVMAVSVFAQALGMLAATTTMPAGIPAVDKGIRDLRQTFSADLVNLAIKNVGRDDILVLAEEVGSLYINRMRKQYGDWQTTSALASAPPGDLRAANEIAATLAGQKVTELSTPEVKEKAIEAGKKKGKRVAKPVKDTKTGIEYPSKSKAGMAVAAEYGLNPNNTFIWYDIIKKDPKRFINI